MGKIKILYANLNSYINKKYLIQSYIQDNHIDCTMFVETKTRPHYSVSYRDWTTIRQDGNVLNENIRGGSLVQAAQSMNLGKANPPRLNNPSNNCIHFTIPYHRNRLHIFLVYAHSLSIIEDNILTKAALYEHCIIIGDFNLNNNTKKKKIENFINNSNFEEVKLPGPTFIMTNNPSSTPDKILCTASVVPNIELIELVPELCSDHLGIQLSINLDTPPQKNPDKYIICYEKCNMVQVNRELMDFVTEQPMVTENMISEFTEKIKHSVEENSPKIKKTFYKDQLPPYILRMIKLKRQLYREIRQREEPNLKRST